MATPAANNTSAVDIARRGVRHKLYIFYAKHEPSKALADIDQIVEWTYANGESAIDAKMKQKYGEDLTTMSVKSYLGLPLSAKLMLFYREFDPKKPEVELKEILTWVESRPSTGSEEINSRMVKKYGENLNSFAYAGRLHLRALLGAFFALMDPPRNTTDSIKAVIEDVLVKGAAWLDTELTNKYRVGLPLTVQEVLPPPPPADLPLAVAVVEAPRPKVVSLSKPAERTRPLSMALSMASTPGKLTVSEDAEIRGLVEIFYAKHNPEKLTGEGVDPIMKFVRANGLEALNQKMRDKYGETIDELKTQYTSILDNLIKYYKDVDSTKQNIEDIAAWAIVHGVQPLSERLEQRYGKPLIPKSTGKATDNAEDMDPITLRLRIRQFYQVYDEKPKSEEDINTILAWVLAGSVAQLNKKLAQKYGHTLGDLPPLEVGDKVVLNKSQLPQPPPGNSTPKQPEPMVPKQAQKPVTGAPKPVVVSTPPAKLVSHVKQASQSSTGSSKGPSPTASPGGTPKGSLRRVDRGGEETDSFRSLGDINSQDNYFDEQMTQMRRVTSGQYEGLAVQIRAFYRVHDKLKLENKEAFDLILKWTFKHGVAALNKKFQEHYGSTLDSVKVTDEDRNALKQEEEDEDAVIDW